MQGIEQTTMTDDAATEQVPDHLEGQVSSRRSPNRTQNFVTFVKKCGTHQMHFCAGIHDHGQMLGLITRCEHRKILTNHISSWSGENRESRCSGRLRRSAWRQDISQQIAARTTTFSEFALLFTGVDRPGGTTSGGDETEVDVNTACAEEEEFSGHDCAQCGGFVIFHTSCTDLSRCSNSNFCVSLQLSPRAQVPLAKCLQGVVALYAPLWSPLANFPTPAEPSLRRVSASITAQPAALRSMAEYSLPEIIRHKQICDFVHVVEVSDSARDRLQGLHHCFFGWRTSGRLQLHEVCEPLSQRQQQFRLVSAKCGLGKPLVKRRRVLSCARKDFFV